MESNPVIIENEVAASPEKIWAALTDPDEMRRWYFDIPEFRAEPGAEFHFDAGEDPDKLFRHLCRVTEAVPNKKLAYTWRYEGHPGDSLVSFDIMEEEAGRTRLRVTHTGLATFGDSPEFARENFVGGWTHFVQKALPEYVEETPVNG
jgi:uncharacterized protein YndB with AHSA1/START domain